jgi:hypothetical protein
MPLDLAALASPAATAAENFLCRVLMRVRTPLLRSVRRAALRAALIADFVLAMVLFEVAGQRLKAGLQCQEASPPGVAQIVLSFGADKPDSVPPARPEPHGIRLPFLFRPRPAERDCGGPRRLLLSRKTPDATYPRLWDGPSSLLFCLAPEGVFRAARLAAGAVGSYPAFSPLPSFALASYGGRFVFCDTVRRPVPRRGTKRLGLPCGSTSILPYGVRTFLSKVNGRGDLTAPWDQRTRSDSLAPKLRRVKIAGFRRICNPLRQATLFRVERPFWSFRRFSNPFSRKGAKLAKSDLRAKPAKHWGRFAAPVFRRFGSKIGLGELCAFA